MLPRTEFYEFGKRLMFLMLNNRYSHIENSRNCEDDFLFASGLKFPLVEGDTLEEATENYKNKFGERIEKYKEDKIKEIQNLKIPLQDLQQDLEKNEFLAFFLEQIQNLNDKKTNPVILKDKENGNQKGLKWPILKDTLSRLGLENIFVVNRRIFLLVHPDNVKRDPFIKIKGREYYLAKTKHITDDIEEIYQKELERELREEALEEAPLAKSLKQEIEQLKSYIKNLEEIKDLKKKEFCYEVGSVGLDTQKNLLYRLIPAFYNEYHGRNYEEGRSAFGIPIIKKNDNGTTKISFNYNDADRKFLTREDENRGFSNAEWACIGFGKMGSRNYNPQDPDNFYTALRFLRIGATTIKRKHRHHIGVNNSE